MQRLSAIGFPVRYNTSNRTSPRLTDKGAKWATEIFKELSTSTVCIIVLTRDNLNSNWIMFEAGAISSTIENARVCPIIFDLEPTDLQGPLAQFQITKFVKEDIRRLFTTINSAAGDNRLADSVAEAVFNKWWPDLEAELKRILEGHKAKKDAKRIRSDRDLIEEILLLTRSLSSTEKIPEPKVGGAGPAPAYEGSLYQELTNTIDYILENSVIIANTEEVRQRISALQNRVSKRMARSNLQTGLQKAIGALESKITALEDTNPKKKEEDEIPF